MADDNSGCAGCLFWIVLFLISLGVNSLCESRKNRSKARATVHAARPAASPSSTPTTSPRSEPAKPVGRRIKSPRGLPFRDDILDPGQYTHETHETKAAYDYLARGRELSTSGIRQGREKSIEQFTQVKTLFPDSGFGDAEMALSYAGIARLLRESGGSADSVRHYLQLAGRCLQSARLLRPDNPTVQAAAALYSYYNGDTTAARNTVRAALDNYARAYVTPRFIQAYVTIVAASKEQLPLLRPLADSCPNCAEFQNLLGLAYLRVNQPDSAEKRFRRALTLSPEYIEARRNLALVVKGQRPIE